jgi:hypothetical protein
MSNPSQPEPPRPPLFDAPADDLVQYRGLSSLAVAGLVVALASPLALLAGPLGWIVPVVGLVLNALALVRIARAAPALVGRKAALAGLALSALFAAAAVTQWFVGYRMLRNEAQRAAAVWFDALRQGNAQKAQQLTLDPKLRPPPDEDARDIERRDPRRRADLKNFVSQPAVRALLALGPNAQVRFYETANQGEEQDHPWVQLTYAVTYDDPAAGRTSFFITLTMDRFVWDGRADWRVLRVEGGVRPEGW